MPFSRPNLQQLLDRAVGTINSELPGADANLQKSILRVLAIVTAEMINGCYGYLDFISRQPFADTAEDKFLVRIAAIFGLTKKQAHEADGNIICTGVNGSVIPIDEQLQRADGVFFKVTSATAISGSTTVPVEALEVGTAGNTAATSVLTFISPISGVDATAAVDADGLTGGSNIETTDELRARLLVFIRTPPQGGAKIDYEDWTLEVAGVTKVWVYPLEAGLGTVTIRFLVEATDANPNGIPDAGDITRVHDYIETVRPVTAKEIEVLAPVPTPLDFEVLLEVNDTPDVRAAVEAELRAMMTRLAEPGGKIYLSWISEAVSLATGEYANKIIDPTNDVTFATGELPIFGTLTFA
jgi:uncharacterized phage protein gp47/JayE